MSAANRKRYDKIKNAIRVWELCYRPNGRVQRWEKAGEPAPPGELAGLFKGQQTTLSAVQLGAYVAYHSHKARLKRRKWTTKELHSYSFKVDGLQAHHTFQWTNKNLGDLSRQADKARRAVIWFKRLYMYNLDTIAGRKALLAYLNQLKGTLEAALANAVPAAAVLLAPAAEEAAEGAAEEDAEEGAEGDTDMMFELFELDSSMEQSIESLTSDLESAYESLFAGDDLAAALEKNDELREKNAQLSESIESLQAELVKVQASYNSLLLKTKIQQTEINDAREEMKAAVAQAQKLAGLVDIVKALQESTATAYDKVNQLAGGAGKGTSELKHRMSTLRF